MPTATIDSPPAIAAPRVQPSRLLIVLAFFAIYVVWGTTYLAIRFAVETIPPLVTAGIRHTTAGFILLGNAWWRGVCSRRGHWISGAALWALFFFVGPWASLLAWEKVSFWVATLP